MNKDIIKITRNNFHSNTVFQSILKLFFEVLVQQKKRMNISNLKNGYVRNVIDFKGFSVYLTCVGIYFEK